MLLTVILLCKAAIMPKASRYPDAWSMAWQGSGLGANLTEGLPLNSLNAFASAYPKPVAVCTSESNYRKGRALATQYNFKVTLTPRRSFQGPFQPYAFKLA